MDRCYTAVCIAKGHSEIRLERRPKSTVLGPAIPYCTDDQSDFASPHATVIAEL